MQGSKFKNKKDWHYNTECTYKGNNKIYCGEKDTTLITENDR